MTFTITIVENNKPYELAVTRIKETVWIEEYQVVSGPKSIVFRTNRPELRKLKRTGRMHWQLVSTSWTIEDKDIERASVFLLRIQDAIEEHLEPSLTFQQVRNKTQ